MSRVFVGEVSPTGLTLIETFLNKYDPTAKIEPLGRSGVKGKVKNHGSRADVLLIIIDDANYELCKPVAGAVLEMSKTHRYVNDTELEKFLVRMFGELDSNTSELSVIEPITTEVELASNKEELNDLQEKLSQANLLIKNLTEQLENKDSDSDVSDFIKRIRELEEQLKNTPKVDTSQYDKEVSSLKEQVATLEGQLSESKSLYNDSITEVNKLQELLKSSDKDTEYSNQIKAVEAKVLSLEQEIVDKDAKIVSLNSEIDSFAERVSVLANENALLSEQTNGVDSLIEAKVAEKEAEYTEKVSSLETNLDEITSERDSLNKIIEELKSNITELNSQIDTLSDNISVQKEKLAEYESNAGDEAVIRQELEEKKSEVQTLKTSVKEYLDKIDELELALATKDGELSALGMSSTSIRESYDSAVSELEIYKASNSDLSNKVSEQDTRITELTLSVETITGEKSALESLIETMKGQITDYESQVMQLNSTVSDLEAQIETLQSQRSSDELLEEKRKVVRLETELKTLKEHGFGVRHDSEVDALKARIKELEEDTSATVEINELNAKVRTLEEELNEYRGSTLASLEAFLAPKASYAVKLWDLPDMQTKVTIAAAGNSDSNVMLYKALHDYCAGSKERIIFIDFSLDTQVDMAFQTKSPPSPISWLDGKDVFKNCLCATKFNHVKVITAGLSYCNDMFYLGVDWSSILKELDGMAERVIINFGCLTNFVAKLLFCAFTSKYSGAVVINASPINLRTSILNITGFGNSLKNVTAYCYDIDATAHKNLYPTLATKCQAKVMKPKELLRL